MVAIAHTGLAPTDQVAEGPRAFLRPDKHGNALLDLAIEGMNCASCMAKIERAMGKEPGVISARVNLSEKRLSLTLDQAGADPARTIRTLEALGFAAFPFSPGKTEETAAAEFKRLLRALGVAGFASMNIMLLSVVVWSGHDTNLDPAMRDFFHWTSALIALPAVAYSGRSFFESAIRALKARRVNMDVPITLGICLGLIMSVAETARGAEHAYFDGVVMLIFFLLIGRVLDAMMQKRTRAIATNLAAFRAETAAKRLPDGSLITLPIRAIQPGDVVFVRPGERIPLDGLIETGASTLDQSIVTGETAGTAVLAGDTVYAGAMNLTGPLTLRVAKPYDGTLLADVERLLEKANAGKGAYVTLADRAAALYPPFVHSAAALTFLGWMMLGKPWHEALIIAITVLIITCPCALGLAVPAVRIVAHGLLFRRGVLVQSGDAVERLGEVDHIIFDKTGTLTTPTMTPVNIADIKPELIARAARLAHASTHPLSRALAALVPDAAPITTIREVSGEGLSACEGGHVMKLGSIAFCGLETQAVTVTTRYPEASLVGFVDGDHTAIFAFAQPLRIDALNTVKALQSAGYPVEILSGDREIAVRRAAEALAITDWRAGASPADKVMHLEALKAAGRHPLMIGDGLNDAAALSAAHASISPASATHLAQMQADFLILGEKLAPSLFSLRLCRSARRRMLENLWFSVVYNLAAVPIAVMGAATPLVAALAMSGSSLIVMLNALRLSKQHKETP